MLSPTRSKCGKAVYLTLHFLCSAGLLFGIILKHLKVCLFSCCFLHVKLTIRRGTVWLKKSSENIYHKHLLNSWTRGKMLFTVFLCRKLSMTQLLHEQLEQKLNCLLDVPKHIGKRTPKKTIWPLYFCQTLTYCHSNAYVCLWLKLK